MHLFKLWFQPTTASGYLSILVLQTNVYVNKGKDLVLTKSDSVYHGQIPNKCTQKKRKKEKEQMLLVVILSLSYANMHVPGM